MSPTMALVPTRPFTFFQLLRSQYLLLLLVLGLLTGTMIVPLLSSMSLAHFNNRLSRAESLFTTFAFTHTTTYYGFNFAAASACTNAFTITMIIAILASVPTSVFPPLHGPSRTHRAGGRQMAGGSRESHLTIKPNGQQCVSVLPLLLLTHFYTHFNSQPSIHWTDSSGSICSLYWWCWWCVRWFLRLLSGSLAISIHLPLPTFRSGEQDDSSAKNSLFPRSARAASIQENGRKRANWTGWA